MGISYFWFVFRRYANWNKSILMQGNIHNFLGRTNSKRNIHTNHCPGAFQVRTDNDVKWCAKRANEKIIMENMNLNAFIATQCYITTVKLSALCRRALKETPVQSAYQLKDSTAKVRLFTPLHGTCYRVQLMIVAQLGSSRVKWHWSSASDQYGKWLSCSKGMGTGYPFLFSLFVFRSRNTIPPAKTQRRFPFFFYY